MWADIMFIDNFYDFLRWNANRSATNIKGFIHRFLSFMFFSSSLSFFVFILWKWFFTSCLRCNHSKCFFFQFFFALWNFIYDSCHNPIRLSSRRKGLNAYCNDCSAHLYGVFFSSFNRLKCPIDWPDEN